MPCRKDAKSCGVSASGPCSMLRCTSNTPNAAPHDLVSHKQSNTPCKTRRNNCLDGNVEQSNKSTLAHLHIVSCWRRLHRHSRCQPHGPACTKDLASHTALPNWMQCVAKVAGESWCLPQPLDICHPCSLKVQLDTNDMQSAVRSCCHRHASGQPDSTRSSTTPGCALHPPANSHEGRPYTGL